MQTFVLPLNGDGFCRGERDWMILPAYTSVPDQRERIVPRIVDRFSAPTPGPQNVPDRTEGPGQEPRRGAEGRLRRRTESIDSVALFKRSRFGFDRFEFFCMASRSLRDSSWSRRALFHRCLDVGCAIAETLVGFEPVVPSATQARSSIGLDEEIKQTRWGCAYQ